MARDLKVGIAIEAKDGFSAGAGKVASALGAARGRPAATGGAGRPGRIAEAAGDPRLPPGPPFPAHAGMNRNRLRSILVDQRVVCWAPMRIALQPYGSMGLATAYRFPPNSDLNTPMSTFVAIDFETANRSWNSACAIGLAAGHSGRIVAVKSFLIRPPTPQFEFSRIHGIRWSDVCDVPTFAGLWPMLLDWIDNTEFVAAHNARFDRKVLEECCAMHRFAPPRHPFICTVELARATWGIYPTTLPDVCRQLSISLHHHEPGSDAEACARIVLAAEAEGWKFPRS